MAGCGEWDEDRLHVSSPAGEAFAGLVALQRAGLGRLRRRRQVDRKSRAAVDIAPQVDGAAVSLDDRAADRKAEPTAADGLAMRPRGVGLVEAVEHATDMFFVDATACVGDL